MEKEADIEHANYLIGVISNIMTFVNHIVVLIISPTVSLTVTIV